MGETLAVCPEHKLTTKYDDVTLDDQARTIIAKIKRRKEEEIKEQIKKKTTRRIKR